MDRKVSEFIVFHGETIKFRAEKAKFTEALAPNQRLP